MCMLRIETTEIAEDTESSSSEEELEEESSNEERGSLLATESNDIIEFAIEGYSEALQMFKEIARRYEEVFPRVSNKRYLHPY
ncbi:hypothetical protein LTR27_013061 [Elasticomyces elasticus]|nr:hypothetical protein LTR27_013061 [Elasticomyces elasticus]